MDTVAANPSRYTLSQLVLYMLRLGSIGFGGPVALTGAMHRDLVEERHWIGEADYREGLALAQLMPGPLAAQLAMYHGYVDYRVKGATLVGIAFVLPSFLMVVALGWAYVRYGGLPWMQAVFYGVGAAVIGIIAVGAYKLTRKTVGSDKLLWTIYIVAFAVTVITESEIAWLFIAAGVVAWIVRAPPRWLGGRGLPAAVASLPEAAGIFSSLDWPLLARIAVFFGEAGAFVFGSGLRPVPLRRGRDGEPLAQRKAVRGCGRGGDDHAGSGSHHRRFHRLPHRGIGGCLRGRARHLHTLLSLHDPSSALLQEVRKAARDRCAGRRNTAAAIGAISGAVVVLAKRSIVDTVTALVAIATLVLLLTAKKLPEPALIAVAAIIGLVAYPLLHP